MAFSLFSVVSLSVIYRLTINLPELPYTQELKNVESDEYVNTSRDIGHSIQALVADLEGRHTARVVDYKYHKIIGSLVYVDLYAEKESPRVSDVLLSAIKSGKIGNLTVSDEGFELHVVRDSESSCATTEFTCLDKTCIPADRRCDGRRDCPDGSDEHKDHGKCKQHQPIIHQTEKVVFAPKHGSIHLSAAIDHSIGDSQIAWSKDGVLLGVGSVTLAEDPRVTVYQKGEKHHLRIVNATDSDDGTYKMLVQGMNVEADFEVRITSDRVAIESDDCPSGERACKSGHCLPVSQFCDRRVQCPDGDDEEHCSEVQCKSNEFRCESTNVCVPTVVVCDGWRDCHDGSDEKSCSHPRKIYKPHHVHHVKVNALCHDGSEPEFSLHGSSYCWSNKVCPSQTECVHGLCCPIAKTRKRQSECLEGQFKCGTGQCIEESQKCNRKYDCADGSDETTCEYYIAVQKYHAEQRRQEASSREAAPQTAAPAAASPEIEDPEGLVCNDQEFRCPYLAETKCFHYDKLCDGSDDCGDGSDEANCDSNEDQDQPAAPVPPPVPAPESVQEASSRCAALQFECKRDGKCIDKALECNHKYDCEDGSDETECEYFKAAMARREESVATTTQHAQQHHHAQQQHHQAQQHQAQQHHTQQHQAQQHQAQQHQAQQHQAQQLHPAQPAQPAAQPSHDQHEEHRRRLEEHRRREEEHRLRQEEENRSRAHQQALMHASQVESTEVTFHDEYDGDSGVGCLEHEFQCAIGECIDKRRVCDTRPDCLDASDEQNCADRAPSAPQTQPAPHHQQPHVVAPSLPPVANYPDQDIDSDDETSDIQITVFPTEKEVRDGRDVSFDCRARTSDNSVYPTVRWARVGGPLPASAHDAGGRLTINPVSLSDAGTYICVSDYNGQSVEARATLNVVSYGPQEVSNGLRPAGQCMADEKACGNNECVKNEYVCDGEPDCRDRSDEANCPSISRTCEPNEFKCNNNKCVQKMWLCDGDDDCGDNSDELNCNAKSSNTGCKPTEFQCHDRRQCVPSSFHCDGTNDCHDGSDEVGCVQPTVVDPPQTNLQVPRGSTFSLTCKAVAVPEPYINWRLNWGPVCEPPRCLQTSEGGFGTLTIHDAQPVDQGAYTCEAINVKGRVLATPDCIVRVVDEQRPQPPPPTAPPQRASCDTRGAVSPYPNNYGSCDCKPQVTGPNCDQCKPGSFHLSEKSPDGCLKCFCFGVTQDCRSSGYYRTKVSIDYTRGDRDQLELTTSDSRQPFSPQTRPYVSGQQIEFRSFEEARGQTLYWKLPEKFLGDKVTAYGGVLKYTFRFSGNGNTDQGADVILRGNDITLQYKHREPLHPDRENTVEISIFETNWQRVDGQQATREHLLMTLADLDTLLIKSTYNDDCTDSSLISVNFEFAEPYGQGLTAAEVEQCICPPGYVGTSCEDCAPGYSRTGGGLYLGLCEKCECNGHASQCDKEYGYCLDCQHNTEGDQCERCKPGFVGDARRGTPNDCQPEATRAPCHCNNHSPRGCDSFGRCLLCEHNTEGTHCERCKKGYYGDATKGSPYDCTPCPCPGASDCYLDQEGQVACRICPAGLQGRLCNECAPGYTRSNKPAGRVCEPIGQVTNEDITFVQKPHEGGRPPQPVIDPPHLVVNEGELAAFRCWVPGIPDCQITWHRDQLGGPLPHGVYQTGNALKIPQSEMHHAGRYICSAANQYGIGQSPPAVLEVKKPIVPPKVDPVRQTVERGQPARFKCWVPGNSNVQLKWSRPGGGHLPNGVQEHQGILHIPRATDHEAGEYVCTATDPRDNTPLQSEPVSLNIKDPAPQPRSAPQIDPPNQTVNVNDPAQFRCWVPGQPRAQLKWARKDGRPLPQGVLERDGFLRIDKAQLTDAGDYECTASEPDGSTQRSPPARLNVNQPQAIQPQIDPPVQTVNEGEPSRIRCWVPGQPNIQLQFVKRGRRPLPVHARVSQGNLEIPRTLKADEDEYICIATDPSTNRPVESNPARVIVKSPIRPIIEPAEQTVPEGSPFRIRCYVPGHPSVQLSFRKVSGQLNDDADENNGLLAIQRAELSDEGDYLCTARDPDTGAPVESNPATVHVTSGAPPPSLEAQPPSQAHPVITPQTQTIPEGDPAQIQCEVPGNPTAAQFLSFERVDGRALPFGSSDSRGVLTIPSTQVQDAGNYVCVYHPEHSRPQKTNPSTLHVTPEGAPPRPVATPPLLSVAPGSPARFNCVAHSDTPARITWGHKEENGPLPEGVRQEGDDIVISSAGDDNIGEYICAATNNFGTGVADPVRLEVTEDQEPPTAVVEPRTWNGKPGERHQFRCITTGSPTPKITWTGPNGSPLPHDVTPLEPNILDFSNGRSELNGDYTCTASNPIGEATDHGSVNIGPSLTVKTNPAGPKLIVTVGEPLQVKCEAFGAPGDPEPEVEWLHDPGPERGDLPDDFKPVTISEQFIRHPNVGLGNAGVYTCKGSSAHATATKNIYIEVVEPSRIATVSILGGSSQWFDQGEKGELICTATGSSLVDRLEWEKVDDQLPTDVEEHNEPGLLHFPSFKNSYAGEYRCNGYRNDEIIASAAVHVHSSSEADDEPKVEIEPPRVRVVSQGDSIVLKCSVQGAENGDHFKWALLRGGSLVRQLGTEPTLEVNRADPSNDFGVYRCNVEDNNGLVIGSAYTAVSVGQQDKTHAQIVKFDDKSDASFTCPIYSVPGSKVEWTYENRELPAKAVPNGNKIEVKEFDDSTSGLYVCRVSFEGNVVEGFVSAQMFVPDTIIQVLLEVSSESPQIGDRAWFDCKVTGDPSAVITWNKEGNDDLPPNAQVTGGRLLFTDLKEENAGVYRCVAKTKAGPLQTRTVLNVGSGKRKRKHLGNRRGRRLRHRRRNAQNPASRRTRNTTKLFGSWF